MTPETGSQNNRKSDCRQFVSLLNDYVDGRLNADSAWRVRTHITICDSCRSSVSSLVSVAQILSDAPRRQVPATFALSLESRLAAYHVDRSNQSLVSRLRNLLSSRPAQAFGIPTLRLAPVATLALCSVFAILLVWHPLSPSARISSPMSAIPSKVAEMPDQSVIETCMDQHRSLTTSDPLSDTSAQVLAASVDNLPVDASKNQNLSDDDAAVLLDEEM